MNLVRHILSLAEDIAEAILELPFMGCYNAADDLWDWTCAERLAEKEAEEEVHEPQCNTTTIDNLELGDWRISVIASPSSPAASVADAAAGETPGASVGIPPADVAGTGHPNLTPDQLDDAAWAVRCYAAQRPDWSIQEAWLLLADDLEAASQATK